MERCVRGGEMVKRLRKVTERRIRAHQALDNHKARRQLHKLYIREGYTAEISNIDPRTGKKDWVYSYKVGLQLREPMLPTMGLESRESNERP